MAKASRDQLNLIDIRGARRILLLPLVGICGYLVYLCACWYFGNTLAEFAPPLDQGGKENALTAVRLAPSDPLTHWVLGNLEKSSLDPSRWPEALAQYEQAVRLSPNDYRLWMDLGRAREQSGDPASGEKALRRAVELGPAYGYPRWYLGNLLLRQGRRDEAFAELRLAGEANTTLRPQVFVLAWHFYDENVSALETNLAGSPGARAQLAVFLAGQNRPDDAVRIWRSLSVETRQELIETGRSLLSTLYVANSFNAAAAIEKTLRTDGSAERDKFSNPSFEMSIGGEDASLFAWKVNKAPLTEVSLDPNVFHSGRQSLRIAFKGYVDPFFTNIWQIVTVAPDTTYRLQFFVKTDALASGGPPLIEVFDPQDPKTALGLQSPGITGSVDWQPVTIEFKTAAKTQAVAVRTNRGQCVAPCPIFGTIWYDDFNVQPVSAAAKPAN